MAAKLSIDVAARKVRGGWLVTIGDGRDPGDVTLSTRVEDLIVGATAADVQAEIAGWLTEKLQLVDKPEPRRPNALPEPAPGVYGPLLT